MQIFDGLIAEYELRAKYNDDVRDYEVYSMLIKAREDIVSRMQASYIVKYKETVHVEIDEPEDVDVYTFHCPNCGNELGDSDWDGHPTSDWQGYCGDCGQKIDWMHDVSFPKVTDRRFAKGVRVGEIYGNTME